MFDEDEDEYVPNYETQQQPVVEQIITESAGHPIGFGAERANLMQEQEVSMPDVSTQQSYLSNDKIIEEEETKEIVTSSVKTEMAKNTFLDEISKLSSAAVGQEFKQVEFSDEQLHFTVTNPVKAGSAIKYTVIG